uniref:Uncharacterized protein n=1 Tax=Ananas comosus var. bracteatus TaxID=296719 RepID=A0A6V7Q569_ANACO|nr:unnamed protein product [Ananas comosus var. bracteatus]
MASQSDHIEKDSISKMEDGAASSVGVEGSRFCSATVVNCVQRDFYSVVPVQGWCCTGTTIMESRLLYRYRACDRTQLLSGLALYRYSQPVYRYKRVSGGLIW